MRKWTETVKSWPDLTENRFYKIRVRDIRKKKKQIAIILEFLEEDQLGRSHADNLELPIRPAGRTADFFHACGQSVEPEKEILPKETISKEIMVSFLKQENGSEFYAIRFKPIKTDKEFAKNAEPEQTQTNRSNLL